MGMLKNAVFPFYEDLLNKFEDEHGRTPTEEENSKLWDQAGEEWESAMEARVERMMEEEKLERGYGGE